MKTAILSILLLLAGLLQSKPAHAQAAEIEQLLLNVEKLTQYKQILSDLKTGYDVLDKGYGTIKDISEGNFNLHNTFLTGLLAVSPTVQKYHKIADIISNQLLLISEYKSALSSFKANGGFSAPEITYLQNVYGNLISQSLTNLDELTNVITANKLRMSDDERIKAIDHIDADMADKLQFLRSFNSSTALLAAQRQKALQENQGVKTMYGIN
ncbi:TerB family tellurite resistance protein [Mucilaginibacter sp. SMC90]|uniref:TerB family tellurite resistance protein n=1 Tax=Mucilaginibacter sp. SMC90 TaxID=2929803 RepID=UPI001FB3FB81|nr:TerB family tellurite resistance protein [Mucilaginibacter sp. SMC90]UOE51352.1 TerB family tellurite resistance protein [Mucilaginibacter sp. SMC90]